MNFSWVYRDVISNTFFSLEVDEIMLYINDGKENNNVLFLWKESIISPVGVNTLSDLLNLKNSSLVDHIEARCCNLHCSFGGTRA